MYGLQEALSRERCAEWQRRSSRRELGEQLAASRRWRRRAEQARRSAESLERRADESARSDTGPARSEFGLAGR